jgi:hypothetical protein
MHERGQAGTRAYQLREHATISTGTEERPTNLVVGNHSATILPDLCMSSLFIRRYWILWLFQHLYTRFATVSARYQANYGRVTRVTLHHIEEGTYPCLSICVAIHRWMIYSTAFVKVMAVGHSRTNVALPCYTVCTGFIVSDGQSTHHMIHTRTHASLKVPIYL